MSNEESQFQTPKSLFFSREAAERMSVERSLKALVHIFHPAGFSSTRHGCIWVRGGSPECLNGRWLPKKEKKMVPVYINQGMKYLPLLSLFLSNCTKFLLPAYNECDNSLEHVLMCELAIEWVSVLLGIAFADCFMSLKKDGDSKDLNVLFKHSTDN